MRARRLGLLLTFALPLAFIGVWFVFPLARILSLSFAETGGIGQLFSDSYYLRVVWFSAYQAALSTALTLVLGLPGALLFARYQFPGKTVFRALATVPFVMPTVVVAVAFVALLGPRGLLNTALQTWLGFAQPPIQLVGTLGAVLLAHVFYNYSVVLRLVGGFWKTLDPRLEQAAAVLGANCWQVFREVTLPLLLPAIGAAALLTFIFTFSSFGIILVLGGQRMATVEVAIYRETAQLLQLDLAAALALIQMLTTLLMTLVYTRLQARSIVPLEQRGPSAPLRSIRTLAARLLLSAVLLTIVLLHGAPLVALAVRSLIDTAGEWTLAYYRELGVNRTRSFFFVPPLIAIRNSLVFATATMLLALAVGIPAAYLLARRNGAQLGRWQRGILAGLDALFMLPLGTSATTLGLGYVIAFGTLGVLEQPWIIPVAHALLAFPFVVRSVLPALRSLDPRLREAARSLGATPMRVWYEIDLPLLTPAILVAAVFAFTVSLGEFGAALLINQARYPTVPIVIFRFLGQPGALNYGQAMALSTILMLLSALSFILLERLGYRELGEL